MIHIKYQVGLQPKPPFHTTHILTPVQQKCQESQTNTQNDNIEQ